MLILRIGYLCGSAYEWAAHARAGRGAGLSDDEIARVSTREAGPPLGPGEEYLDLKHLKHGVRYMTSMTHVKISDLLPRNVVSDETWSKICARLSS